MRPDEGALEDVEVQRVEEPAVVLQREAAAPPRRRSRGASRCRPSMMRIGTRKNTSSQSVRRARAAPRPAPAAAGAARPGPARRRARTQSSSRIWQSSGSQATAAASPRFQGSGLMSWPSLRTRDGDVVRSRHASRARASSRPDRSRRGSCRRARSLRPGPRRAASTSIHSGRTAIRTGLPSRSAGWSGTAEATAAVAGRRCHAVRPSLAPGPRRSSTRR